MNYTSLGRTGLRVSRVGLGCGGASRLGLGRGATTKNAIELVDHALALGINIIDTAPAYGTEASLGEAVRGKREQVVLATKTLLPGALAALPQRSILNRLYRRVSVARGRLITAQELRRNLERSLKTLRTDYVDIYLLQAVTPGQYPHCVAELLPTLERLRDEGKIRFLGITEALARDSAHRMLERAVDGGHWDVIMLRVDSHDTSARKTLLPAATEQGQGVLAMGVLRPRRGAVERAPLPETAYASCAREPGVHVVFSGTGSRDHLSANVQAINDAHSNQHAPGPRTGPA